MDEVLLKAASPYFGCCIILPTKHQKSNALAPVFDKVLQAGILEYVVDTDLLGTFSGEIKREGTALECAQKKCEWALQNGAAQYAVASEGSFGPHPWIPFMAANTEILYFIDKARDFHLYVADVFAETNYQMTEVASYEELLSFADKALFPSHALILRSCAREKKGVIFKGLQTKSDLESAFREALKASPEKKAYIQTDMRAHLNPTRMKNIEKLGARLARRLLSLCPRCATPGWGKVDRENGLPCEWCDNPTDVVKKEIFGCTKCIHKEKVLPSHGQVKADPGDCGYCNP
ncbi:MAG: DUF6671 family protein [Alphaproteobacteria bacterium]